jgi:5'-nucleotidase
MPVDLKDKLVIGISSRALFDLEEANRVYESDGLSAYREYQRQHEEEILDPGTAFPLVQGLLAVNERAGEQLVEVIIFSRNDAESAMRIFRSIEAHGLPITRGIFRNGRELWPFVHTLGCDVYLSADPNQVMKARLAGVPSALIMPAPETPETPETEDLAEVRIAFDGDAVIFGAESQRVFDTEGLDAFHAHEAARADDALSSGPFRPFLDGIARIQARLGDPSPIRTALVTARGAPAHYRVINTLRSWGVRVDETYFLGGVGKAEVLAAFGAHIFFDDQASHAEAAAAHVPSAQVLWPAGELPPKAEPSERPVVVEPARRRRRRDEATPEPIPIDIPPADRDRTEQETPTG